MAGNRRISQRRIAISLSLIILSFVIVVPYLYVYNTGYTGRYTGTVRLQSSNALWFNSSVRFSTEDGYVEILHFETPSPWPGTSDSEPVTVIMGLTLEYEFLVTESCYLDFSCPGLSLELGPYQFNSDVDTILYSDDNGNEIRWSVMLIYDFER